MRRPRRPSLGHWVAASAAAALAVALPFMGPWTSSDREAAGEPAAAAKPRAEPRRRARPHRTPAARRRRAARAERAVRAERAARRRVAIGAFVPNGTRRPSLLRAYARITGRRPAILLYFRSWRSKHAFDAVTLRRLARAHAVPMVSWEPKRRPLREIASGRFDPYIRTSARDARRFGRPILVRFAHEMNGDWYSWGSHVNSPRTFVRAWRRIVRIFRAEGAGNARFVWSPNADDGPRQQRLIRRLYPGDAWVDWVGLSGFSWGGPWDWEPARDIFRDTYRTVARMTDRPLMIAETATGELGGSKARWIASTFGSDLPSMPRVRAVVWFNGRERWASWSVYSSRASLRAYRSAVASPRYSGTARDVEREGGP